MFEFIKRIFPDKSGADIEWDQASLTDSRGNLLVEEKPLSRTKYRVASCQSAGMERSHNEDSLFTFDSLLAGLESSSHFGLYLVADGMGGHQGGEIASTLAAQGAGNYLLAHVFAPLMIDRQSISGEDFEQLLREAVEEAQKLIRQRVPGGGTTLTLALAIDDQIYVAQVGDSRLYLIKPDGETILKTRDHSLVKRLVDLGEITEDEASVHPQRNILYRALGQMDPFEPDIGSFPVAEGDRLLICSDGLWSVVPEGEILEILKKCGANLEKSACDLVNAANHLGGPDNISVILVERII